MATRFKKRFVLWPDPLLFIINSRFFLSPDVELISNTLKLTFSGKGTTMILCESVFIIQKSIKSFLSRRLP